MKILLLDDSQEFTTLTSAIITRLGHEVEVISDPSSWSGNRFDLALIDWNLEGYSGIDIIKLMRLQMPQAKFYLISASEPDAATLKSLKAGFLKKPLTPAVISDLLKSS